MFRRTNSDILANTRRIWSGADIAIFAGDMLLAEAQSYKLEYLSNSDNMLLKLQCSTFQDKNSNVTAILDKVTNATHVIISFADEHGRHYERKFNIIKFISWTEYGDIAQVICPEMAISLEVKQISDVLNLTSLSNPSVIEPSSSGSDSIWQ